MPKYVIEREVPGAGSLSPDQLKAISETSCGVLRKLGSEIQWVHSYVTGDKIYCLYIAANEDAGQGARPPGRIPGELSCPSNQHHRSNHRRILKPTPGSRFPIATQARHRALILERHALCRATP